MYKVQYQDSNEIIVQKFTHRLDAEKYARSINANNIQVSVIKVSEELVLSLLPRGNNEVKDN